MAQVKNSPTSSYSIFEWIDQYHGPDRKLTRKEKGDIFVTFIQIHGNLFQDEVDLSPVEEERHYAYYYGDKRCRRELGRPYLNLGNYSPESIAGALFCFAMCVDGNGNGVNRFLELYSLEKQAARCYAFLEAVSSNQMSENPYQISEQHRFAFERVFREICKRAELKLPEKICQVKEESLDDGYFAALIFLQGYVYHLIEPGSKKASELFRAAMEKERNYIFWWHITFLTWRTEKDRHRDRRKLLEVPEKLLKGPLHPQIGISVIMAGLELTKVKSPCYWMSDKWIKSHSTILRTTYNSVKDASEQLSSFQRKWAYLKLSALLIQNGVELGNQENKVFGRERFEDCLSRYPTCHLTQGAMAALCKIGLASESVSSDLKKAAELHSKSLKIHSSSKVSRRLFPFSTFKTSYSTEPVPSSSKTKAKTTSKSEPENAQAPKKSASASGSATKSAKLCPPPGQQDDSTFGDITDWHKLFSSFGAECGPLWVQNLTSRLPQYTTNKFGSVALYLASRLRHREFQLPQYYPDGGLQSESGDENSQQYDEIFGLEEWLSTQISVASLAFVLDQVKVAKDILKGCDDAIEAIPGKILEGHLPVFQYLIQASHMCLELKKFKVNPGKKKLRQNREHEFKLEVLELQKEWENVRNSAVIHYIKGKIAAVMGCVHDISLDQYRKAVNLEPRFYLWHQAIYEKLKQMRTSGSGQNHPSDEEIRSCQKAHELQPENVRILMDLATVKFQNLLTRLRSEFNARGDSHSCSQLTKEVDIISGLLKDVMAYSPENSRYQMLAKIKTAEMFTTRGLPQRNAEAEIIFQECYEKWPKSSMVLHKVGKFYHYIAMKYVKAQKIYCEGLELCPQNYPCLMDCLKVYGRHLQKYGEMVDLIDRSLHVIKEPEHIVNLLIIKGHAYWLHKKMKISACEVWMEAFINFEHLGSKISDELAAPYSHVFGRLGISLAEMCPSFKQVCETKAKNIKGNTAIEKFVKFMEKAEDEHKKSMWR